MATEVVTKDDVIRALDELPAESLVEARRFVDYVRFKAHSRPRKLIKLGGLWKDWPPITDEDIAQARREMWGSAGHHLVNLQG